MLTNVFENTFFSSKIHHTSESQFLSIHDRSLLIGTQYTNSIKNYAKCVFEKTQSQYHSFQFHPISFQFPTQINTSSYTNDLYYIIFHPWTLNIYNRNALNLLLLSIYVDYQFQIEKHNYKSFYTNLNIIKYTKQI